MKPFFKILASIFALLFIVSAALQYNDPDPYFWYAIYLFAAVLCVLFIFGKLPFWLATLAAVGFIIGGIFAWPETFEGVQIGDGDIRNIEEGRESLGLFIIAFVMLLLALRIRNAKRIKHQDQILS
ncbi:transmembrane 220 family protein [Robertkochia solimangrovi]|uniref:transmembrane 220 family protein n=1 Tax=Robertkochia solimangrovi TaxID=2213046 RepID=UPI00117C7B29|nr:transmembrane 220 family protein [Robertkochia solimangrovi]TRZ42891.1 hypothetical protein DMZ48_12560 [Robertkochia solimangrovi]